MSRLSSATLTLSKEKYLRACPTTFNDKADRLAKKTLYTIVSLDIFVTFSNFFHSFKKQATTEAERVEKSWNQNLRVKFFRSYYHPFAKPTLDSSRAISCFHL